MLDRSSFYKLKIKLIWKLSSRETTLYFVPNVRVKFFSVQMLYHFKLVFMFLTSSCFCEEVLFNLIPNEVRETLKVKTVDTYAQREEKGMGHLIYCQKFKNFVIKMQ